MEVPETTVPLVVPPGHLCSICFYPMLDPVCTQVGHTYDRDCIQRWLQSGNRTNPLDNQVLKNTVLVNNIALRQAIESSLSDLEPFRSSPRNTWSVLIKRYSWEERSVGSYNPRLTDVGRFTPSQPLQKNGTGLKEGDITIGPGDAEEQNKLGSRYMRGEGVEKNIAKAYECYRRSAKQGSCSGQCNLGCCYAHGQGVAQNWAEAFTWFQKSAEQGGAFGQHNLGVCYANGWGVSEDRAEACNWSQKSAEQGITSAQYSLGVLYECGEGVGKDVAKAEQWYRKAKDNGKVVDGEKSPLQEKVFGNGRRKLFGFF